jgi:hypothetical protein
MNRHDADTAWGAEVFAQRGGFMAYASSFAVRVHHKDPALCERLVKAFGGKVSRIAGTNQWRIAGDDMLVFLNRIKPLLTNGSDLEKRYGSRVSELVSTAVTYLESLPPRRRRGEGALEAAMRKGPKPDDNTEDGIAEVPVGNVFGAIPAGPWAADHVLFEMVGTEPEFIENGMLLRAEGGAAQATAFAHAAQAAGLKATVEGTFVRLRSSAGVA